MSDPTEQSQAPAEPQPVLNEPEPTPPEPVALPPLGLSSRPPPPRPSFLFFGAVAALSLVADVTSKAWAEIVLSKRTLIDPAIILIRDHLSLTLAYNKGGAWGLLQNSSEVVRRPFFLLVSGLAIAFIVSLYGRLVVGQRALKWGLPLVLGGALGNLSDRIIRSSVIDFVDFRANWIETMNHGIGKLAHGWGITDHWPTFNVADVSICVGVGLMALDMFISKRGRAPANSNPGGGRLAPEAALSTGGSVKPPAP
jgi:signal peptidase II